MASIRIAIVTDIHHGADSFTKKGTAALPLMAEFARFTADARPDIVLDLGDRISDLDEANDLALESEVSEAFRAIQTRTEHLCGNHDRDHLSVEQNARILGRDMAHTTIDIGDWTLVLWQADSKIHRPSGFVLKEADLLWLAGVVRTATRPLAIFSHVPISGHDQTGNYYFERNPKASTYPGAERARAILATARVPVITIAGHVHWNTLTTIHGIPHITLQSLTECFTTHPEPAAAWTLLELSDRISIEVMGRDTMRLDLSAEQTMRRWIATLPPFDEHGEIKERRLAQNLLQAAE